MSRFVILASGALHYIRNKTGNMLIRYRGDEVIAVIDPGQAGKMVRDVLGFGGEIPVISSFKESVQFQPDTLVIGNAPLGGIISDEYRKEIIQAIRFGCDIISGMHVFLNDDEEICRSANENGVKLLDLRKPPSPPHFPKGTWRDRNVPVLLTVGTDCDTGKMTTAWEITSCLRKRGWDVHFIGTGQTGILLSGYGVPVDAVVGDFMAGEIECAIDKVTDDADLIVVEGQGAITHMLYSGVTLGVLHGAMPDWMVMTHEPLRKMDTADQPMVDFTKALQLHLDLLNPFKPSTFVGINLLTLNLSEEDAKKVCVEYENMYKIPATDLIRFGEGKLTEHIENELKNWN
ncbi:MAG TPA: DUF1611 domain-containing protein [Candidatus Marinimicrobia bacterium]|nr:DUF1611 domain-containing protein [Candidatus Neomarinimicrobiota bacterium]|tara:strand:+ start:3121 stop:4158 length:1038 start_codon:yes stop_codon:yes gene_type:complete